MGDIFHPFGQHLQAQAAAHTDNRRGNSLIVGVDFNPPSVEQYTADQSTVIQLLGSDNVYWVDGGTVYHVCEDVSDIQTSSVIQSGTTAQAIEAGKNRLTLKFASELQNCGLNVPENAEEITSALREIQAGKTDTLLPAPVWEFRLDEVKFTDNTLGFGKKMHWQRDL